MSPNAEYAWQVRTHWIDKPKDGDLGIMDIPAGWEPFGMVGVAGMGWVVHLRRLAPNGRSGAQ